MRTGFFFLRLFFGIIFPTLDRVQYTSVILMKPSVYRQEGKLWIIRLLRLNQNLHLSTLTTYKQRRFCYDGIQFLRFRLFRTMKKKKKTKNKYHIVVRDEL